MSMKECLQKRQKEEEDAGSDDELGEIGEEVLPR